VSGNSTTKTNLAVDQPLDARMFVAVLSGGFRKVKNTDNRWQKNGCAAVGAGFSE